MMSSYSFHTTTWQTSNLTTKIKTLHIWPTMKYFPSVYNNNLLSFFPWTIFPPVCLQQLTANMQHKENKPICNEDPNWKGTHKSVRKSCISLVLSLFFYEKNYDSIYSNHPTIFCNYQIINKQKKKKSVQVKFRFFFFFFFGWENT